MADDHETPTIEQILDVLSEGPLSVEALSARLEGGPAVDVDALDDLLVDPRIVALADGRVAGGVALCRGWTARHRLSGDEATGRHVRLDDDTIALFACAPGPMVVSVGEALVVPRSPLDETGEEDFSVPPVIDLPEGWHPALAAGDVVGLAIDDDGRLVLEVDGFDVAAPGEDGGAAAVVAALVAAGEAHGYQLRVVEDSAGSSDGAVGAAGGWVAEAVRAVTEALARDAAVVRALRRPLTEVYAEADMAFGAGLVAAPGVADHQLRLFQVGYDILGGATMDPDRAEVAEALGMAWLLLLGAGLDEIPDDLRVRAVAAGLSDPVVAEAVADHLRVVPEDVVADGMVERLAEVVAAAPGAPGPAFVLTEAAVITGSAPQVLAVLGDALAAADPDEWEAAFEALGHLRAVAGDIDGAVRVFRALDDPDAVTFLQRWRADVPAGVGRNDRCPCGSGRKYKQCCLVTPRPMALEARVALLWWKAQTWCLKNHFETMPWGDDVDGPDGEPLMFLAADCHLVEDSALAGFSVELGPLLPDDEAALVETWLERPRRLWEVGPVDDDHLELRDLTGPGAVTTVEPLSDSRLGVGEVVLATVVPTGGPHEALAGKVVPIPASQREAGLALLADHPDGQTLFDWVLAVADGAP
ncbi:SEC-C domain-containing protein [Iamia sp.]|uniref:YecA/YgfB family protein n=1 Tax=Iamia sp. TaxID=2722710 RepID=UPI002BB5CC79|nr:SEC-C domain-containing protein [Iamia sp.]HXH57066.1 SEC-C domain-containing protein [Iamia sp.]